MQPRLPHRKLETRASHLHLLLQVPSQLMVQSQLMAPRRRATRRRVTRKKATRRKRRKRRSLRKRKSEASYMINGQQQIDSDLNAAKSTSTWGFGVLGFGVVGWAACVFWCVVCDVWCVVCGVLCVM